MEFCPDCDNMLYINIESNDSESECGNNCVSKLSYYCKNCGYKTDKLKSNNCCIYEENFNTDNIKKEMSFNENTINDPTLPRAIGIRCINANCPSKKPEIIYINYDSKNMKYTYICLDCHKVGNDNYIW